MTFCSCLVRINLGESNPEENRVLLFRMSVDKGMEKVKDVIAGLNLEGGYS